MSASCPFPSCLRRLSIASASHLQWTCTGPSRPMVGGLPALLLLPGLRNVPLKLSSLPVPNAISIFEISTAGKITNTSVNFYPLKLDECVTCLYLRFKYFALTNCFLFAYILFIHLRLNDPSLEISTIGFVFNIGMFRLDSQCTGKINTAPTCHNSC